MKGFWKNVSLVALLVLTVTTAVSCSDEEFQSSQSPGGGAISVNGSNFSPLYLPQVQWVIGAATTTITLGGSYYNVDTLQNENPAVVLVIPNGLYYNPIDIETSGSTFTDSSFVTNTVTGFVTIFAITPNEISGVVNATFTDANDNTRDLLNVNFVVNSFNYHQ